MITVRAAAAPLSRSSGSVTDHQKRRFSVHSPAQIIGISPDDLSRWEFPCGRKWRQDFFFSAEDHSFQNQPNSFSVQTFFVFFSFPDLFGTKIHLGKFYLRSNRKSSLLSSSSRQCEHEWCVQRHPQSVGMYPLLFLNHFYVRWKEHCSRGNSKLRMDSDDFIFASNAIAEIFIWISMTWSNADLVVPLLSAFT